MELEVGGLYRVQYKYSYSGEDDEGRVQQCIHIEPKCSVQLNSVVIDEGVSSIHHEKLKDYNFTYIGKLPTLQELAKQHYPELFV